MKIRNLKYKLRLIHLKLYHTSHHTWAVSVKKRMNSHFYKEVNIVEISDNHTSYFVAQPQYLSFTAFRLINKFAETPVKDRSVPIKARYLLYRQINKHKIEVWYFNNYHYVSTAVFSTKKYFLKRSEYHLTQKQLIKLEQILLPEQIKDLRICKIPGKDTLQ